MQVKFSEDVVPLSDLKSNPGKVVNLSICSKKFLWVFAANTACVAIAFASLWLVPLRL